MKFEITESMATGNDDPYLLMCFLLDIPKGFEMNLTDGKHLEGISMPMCVELGKIRIKAKNE